MDDERRVTEALALVLSDENDVETTTSGLDALQRMLWGAHLYDVVLCDLMMPGLSGMDVYETASRVRPEAAERIVFITGGILQPRIRAFVDRVPNACLDKPIDVGALREFVQRRVHAAPHRWRGSRVG